MPHPKVFSPSSLEGPQFLITAIKMYTFLRIIIPLFMQTSFDGVLVIASGFHARGPGSILDGSCSPLFFNFFFSSFHGCYLLIYIFFFIYLFIYSLILVFNYGHTLYSSALRLIHIPHARH